MPPAPTATDGPRAGRESWLGLMRTGSAKVAPLSAERLNHRRPSYSVQAAYRMPLGLMARSRLPLSQWRWVSRPLPSPAMLFERLIGTPKVLPPSVERAKKISPPCVPPEKTISC